MVKVAEREYDNGDAGGDGNLTKLTAFASSADSREMSYAYDFRNRLTSRDGEIDFYEGYAYDNVDRQISVRRYNSSSSGNLVAQAETAYDNLGRVFKNSRFSVDPQTGTVGNSLDKLTWYDASGNVIKVRGMRGLSFVKTTFDGISRPTRTYVACDPDAESYGQAGTVTDDIVLSQTETTYDGAGNAVWIVGRDRNHDATGNGNLQVPNGAQPQARVSYLAQYPRSIGAYRWCRLLWNEWRDTSHSVRYNSCFLGYRARQFELLQRSGRDVPRH